MATKKFTAREMDQLRESPYVLDVTQSIVHFSAQFKALFYEGLQAGKAPAEIVLEHGIDPEILGVNRVNGLKTMVLKEVKAGKGFRDLNTYGTYLEHLLSIKQLCSLACVSRSGYYHYLSTEEDRQRRERQDQEDFQRIVEAYQFRGYAKGARGIYMRLIHMDPPIVMNIKKIRRLVKKYGLNIPVYHEKLGQALSHLMPKDREIILLYFFKGLKDTKVAPLVHMSRPTGPRRRKVAMRRLRELMEDST